MLICKDAKWRNREGIETVINKAFTSTHTIKMDPLAVNRAALYSQSWNKSHFPAFNLSLLQAINYDPRAERRMIGDRPVVSHPTKYRW